MQRLTPADDREACALIRDAATAGKSFEISGAGTKRNLGRPVSAGVILDVGRLSGVIDYQPEELVFSAKAGTPLVEIEAMLGARNQMLGFEPGDWAPVLGVAAGRQTLAGAIAADVSGPRRVKRGGARDHVIGCRFINGFGELIRAGGPVIKNVTGFDIPKLMCGAFGTLGVVTELTLRVLPRPVRESTVVLRHCRPEAGLAALIRAAQIPVEATGLAYLPGEALRRLDSANSTSPGQALIRVDGSSAAIAEKIEVLKQEFRHMDLAILGDVETRILFRRIGDGVTFGAEGDLWRLHLPAAAAAPVMVMLGDFLWLADWAGGLVWLQMPATTESAAELRRITAEFGGHASLFRAPAEARRQIPVFEPEPPVRANLTKAVKQAFDPKNLFNPGRMFEYL
jgi:glycolate oxidase FAD binding subunit